MNAASTPRPPPIDGASEPRRGDVLRIVWWSQRGYRYGAPYGQGMVRLLSAFLAVMWWLVIPLSVAVQAYLLTAKLLGTT